MDTPRPTPIVMTAFGTTRRSIATYDAMDDRLRQRFPGHDIRWAFTSPTVLASADVKGGRELKHPGAVLADLQSAGHDWAVVQSTHIICGWEFHRMLSWTQRSPVRTSIGLPLLTMPEDFRQVVDWTAASVPADESTATVIVGHGTDHPSWSAYACLEAMLAGRFGNRVQFGLVEDPDSSAAVAARIADAGYDRVRLVPFLLVAGMHFQRDLIGEADTSWRRTLERHGLTVAVHAEGLGMQIGIVDIFCRHIRDALDVIPDSVGI